MITTNNSIKDKKPSRLMLLPMGILETFPCVKYVDYITRDLAVSSVRRLHIINGTAMLFPEAGITLLCSSDSALLATDATLSSHCWELPRFKGCVDEAVYYAVSLYITHIINPLLQTLSFGHALSSSLSCEVVFTIILRLQRELSTQHAQLICLGEHNATEEEHGGKIFQAGSLNVTCRHAIMFFGRRTVTDRVQFMTELVGCVSQRHSRFMTPCEMRDTGAGTVGGDTHIVTEVGWQE
ncbi:hypothetical protein Tco_0468702 [Tanacetum coccineum]